MGDETAFSVALPVLAAVVGAGELVPGMGGLVADATAVGGAEITAGAADDAVVGTGGPSGVGMDATDGTGGGI